MSTDGRNPKCPFSTTHILLSVQLSTKYKIRMSNLCVQHDTVAESKHRDIVTCMRVNAIRTILQLTLVTDGHLLRVRLGATKGTYIPIVTHNILIIIVLLCRCGPYMCKYVFPWTIWRVPYLSSNQKLLQMQEYTHVLMQISTGSPPYVPYNASIPHACKQVLNPCPTETMHIVVFLLALRQSLSSDKGPYHMEAPLICTIHGANLRMHIMSLYPPPLCGSTLKVSKTTVTQARVLRQGSACARRAVPKERMSPETCPYLTLSTIVAIGHYNTMCRQISASSGGPHCLPFGAAFGAGLASGFGMGLGFPFLGTKLSSTISLVK